MTDQKSGYRRVEFEVVFHDLNVPEETLQGDGFYVGYNEQHIDLCWCVTTALVSGQMEAFYILNGDHRRQYADVMGRGFEACMEYFMENIDQINKRSDRPDGEAVPRNSVR